jgi:membrane fusion protein, multidrug efflux system
MTFQLSLRTVMMTTVVMLSACHRAEPEKPAIRPAIVAQPSAADALFNSYAGEVTARFQPELSFRVAGKIIKRSANVGNTVKQGQILAQLDPQDAALQLNTAKAQFASATSAERSAKLELERYKLLLAPNAVSRSQYDQIENQYAAAEASLAQAKSQLNLANNQIEYTTLRAPQSGKITQQHIETGQVVAAGQVAFTMATQGDREVLIGIPEQDQSRLQVGQPVVVTIWSQPSVKFAAHVREISPAADASRTFAARIAFDTFNPSINIGQSARVFTRDMASKASLSVPLSAVSADQGEAYVWTVDSQTSQIKKAPVIIESYGLKTATISKGLQPTDWIVIAGVQLVREGQKIKAVDRHNRAIQLVPPNQNSNFDTSAKKQG